MDLIGVVVCALFLVWFLASPSKPESPCLWCPVGEDAFSYGFADIEECRQRCAAWRRYVDACRDQEARS